MKINIGKWLKRQVYRGQPVTVGNTIRLVGGVLDYQEQDPGITLLQMAQDAQSGRLTADYLRDKTDEIIREQLAEEAAKWADALHQLYKLASKV